MNQFFGTHFSQEDLQQRLAQRRRNGAARTSSMSMGPPAPQHNQSTMDTGGMMGGDSLDDIIMQNNKELQRRQSYPHPYGEDMNGDDTRRSSMMEFGSSNNGLGDFQFGTSTSSVGESHLRRQSSSEIEMVGGYSDINGDIGADMLPGQMQFTSGMQTTEPLTIESGFQSMSPDMVQGMMGYGSMGIGMEGLSDGEPTPMIFAPGNFSFTEPMSSAYLMAPTEHDGLPPTLQNQESDEMMPTAPGLSIADTSLLNSPNTNMGQRSTSFGSPATTKMSPFPNQDTYNISGPASQAPIPEPTPVATPVAPPPPPPPPSKEPKIRDQFQDVYSSSGFDMLKALNKVASRPNPEINIGAVDLSCAFVVCDILQNDCPIIYVSDIFERLTGYNKHEVLGRNCRFLQSPHGKVQAGVKRTYVDDDTVHYIKDRLSRNSEVQRSLINYRKGGQPFMNLLTMIPIPWDTDEIRYFVGFQVDLVEQPGSVAGKGSGGSYNVNYQQRSPPKYIWQPPESARPGADAGQTISRDDVSAVLTSFNNSGESELTKRMWDKVLLENTDDVVHVLSLKGLFLYLSPSSKKVLEYDSSELVGTALSSICHPSDIVPVTRELKDTSTGSAVSVVFRIRRKNSGYTWFESHGALCVEQGKGRKCIILVGRERPVYAISKLDIEAVGGIGENELWTKLSTSGMFLFVSSNVRALIDRQPEELIGTSIQSIMRPESKIEFGRSLEKARTGKRISFKHEVLNKRGLVLQAQTNLYPGDAAEGSKPTFLVAQTRFLKPTSRTNGPASSSSSGHSYAREFGEVHSPRSITGPITEAGGSGLAIGSQDLALASDNNIFDELKTTRCTSWQFELRQMEKSNRLLAEELASLLSNKKKRKRRKGHLERDCANCHTRTTPEWRRGPSGQRDLCNGCGLRYAKQTGRVSPRTSTRGGDAASKVSTDSPAHKSPLRKEVQQQSTSSSPNINLRPNPTTSATDSGSSASSTATVLPTTTTGVPASLGGRTTTESQPIHAPSVGFKEGGERRITEIVEENGSVS